jgi:hypothetical protein
MLICQYSPAGNLAMPGPCSVARPKIENVLQRRQ